VGAGWKERGMKGSGKERDVVRERGEWGEGGAAEWALLAKCGLGRRAVRSDVKMAGLELCKLQSAMRFDVKMAGLE
jgi:hypothetical protein